MTKPLHLYGPFPQSIKGAAQVFDYSRMVGRFFEPDEKICLIFDNVKYEKLRELPEFSERHDSRVAERLGSHMTSLANEFIYPDMPCARKWADEFEEGIKAYGFNADQIHRYKDVDFSTIKSAI